MVLPDVPIICIVTVPATNCMIGADVEGNVCASPKYWAVMLLTPTGSDVARKDAMPAETCVDAPSGWPLSRIWT